MTYHTTPHAGKSLITTAQIIQFFTGILCTVPMFVMRGECQTDMQVIASRLVAVTPRPVGGKRPRVRNRFTTLPLDS